MKEFNWHKINKESYGVKTPYEVTKILGEELQRQSLWAIKLGYYALASTVFEALILAYLFIR